MLFSTVGYNFFIGYHFHVSITDNPDDLKRDEAKDYFKIIYIKSGSTHLILNEKEYILAGAYAVCLNNLDRISFLKNADIQIIWFKPSVINRLYTFDIFRYPECQNHKNEQDMYYMLQFIDGAAPAAKVISLKTFDSSLIESRINLIKTLLADQNTEYWPCRSRSCLFEILFSLIRQEDNEIVSYEDFSRLAVDIIYYLQSCYSSKITIAKLAEEFHTNRTTLINEFHKYTGMSINQYLIQLRLNMASTLLRETELSLDEISERTGFNDSCYFSKLFKKKLAYTPSQFRQTHKNSITCKSIC